MRIEKDQLFARLDPAHSGCLLCPPAHAACRLSEEYGNTLSAAQPDPRDGLLDHRCELFPRRRLHFRFKPRKACCRQNKEGQPDSVR